MFCTQCGQKNSEAAKFCFSCGSSLPASGQSSVVQPSVVQPSDPSRAPVPRRAEPPRDEEQSPATAQGSQGTVTRPGIVTLLAILQFVGAFVVILIALAVVGSALLGDSTEGGMPLLFGILFGCVGALEMMCGVGLWRLKSYGRTIQLVLAGIGLLGFPIGTIISVLILVYLNKPGIKLLFGGKPAWEFTADEAAQVAAATQGSLGTVLAVIMLMFVGIAMIGIIAAIAVPGLLRARMSGNEASAIGSLRAINAAQGQYSHKCNGYAATLPELRSAGDFLAADLTSAVTVTKSGYNVTIEPSPNAFRIPNPSVGCVGTISNYFAHSDPVIVGTTGTRYFATDDSGIIFQSAMRIANPIAAPATPIQ